MSSNSKPTILIQNSDLIELPDDFFSVSEMATQKMYADLSLQKDQLIQDRMETIAPGLDIWKNSHRFIKVRNAGETWTGRPETVILFLDDDEPKRVITFLDPQIGNVVTGHEYRIEANIEYY